LQKIKAKQIWVGVGERETVWRPWKGQSVLDQVCPTWNKTL